MNEADLNQDVDPYLNFNSGDISPMNLVKGSYYYPRVRAKNKAGMWSDWSDQKNSNPYKNVAIYDTSIPEIVSFGLDVTENYVLFADDDKNVESLNLSIVASDDINTIKRYKLYLKEVEADNTTISDVWTSYLNIDSKSTSYNYSTC